MEFIAQLFQHLKKCPVNWQTITILVNNHPQYCQIYEILAGYPQSLLNIRLTNPNCIQFFIKHVFPHKRLPTDQQMDIIKQYDNHNPSIKKSLAILKQYLPKTKFDLAQELESIYQFKNIPKFKLSTYKEPILNQLMLLLSSLQSQEYNPKYLQIIVKRTLQPLYKQHKFKIVQFLWNLGKYNSKNCNSYYRDLLTFANNQILCVGYDSYNSQLQRYLPLLQTKIKKEIMEKLWKQRQSKIGITQGIGFEIQDICKLRINYLLQNKKIFSYLIQGLERGNIKDVSIQYMQPSELCLLRDYLEDKKLSIDCYLSESTNSKYVESLLLKETANYERQTQIKVSQLVQSSYPSYNNVIQVFLMLTNVFHNRIHQLTFSILKQFNILIEMDYFSKFGCLQRVKTLYTTTIANEQKQLLIQMILQRLHNNINLSFIMFSNAISIYSHNKQVETSIINSVLSKQFGLNNTQLLIYILQSKINNHDLLELISTTHFEVRQARILSVKILLTNNYKLQKLSKVQPQIEYNQQILNKIESLKGSSFQWRCAQHFINIIHLFQRKQRPTLPHYFTFQSLHYNNKPIVWNWVSNDTLSDDFYRNHWASFMYLKYAQIYLNSIKDRDTAAFIFSNSIKILQQILQKPLPKYYSSQFYQNLNTIRYVYLTTRKNIFIHMDDTNLSTLIEIVLKHLHRQNHPMIRQYLSVILCRAYIPLRAKYRNILIESISEIKISIGIPIVLTLGYEMINFNQKDNLIVLIRFIGYYGAYLRALCHSYICLYIEAGQVQDKFLLNLKQFWDNDKDSQKIIKNISTVVKGFKQAVDQNIDYLGYQRIQQYPSQNVQYQFMSDTIKLLNYVLSQDKKCQQSLKKETQNMKYQISSKMKKMQQNIIPIKHNKQPSIIIIGTLLQKVHNFGHIIRTLHNKNAMLVINNKLQLSSPQCIELFPKDHDVRIIQIKNQDLDSFIALMKKFGYPLVALEQCSNSVNLQDFKFPCKFMMLLGNQRIGAPAKLLKMSDHLVQIPQVGKIRSLNVHVSMVICIWEYLQQFKY